MMGDRYTTKHKRRKPKLTKQQIKDRSKKKNKSKGKGNGKNGI